jgi:hypothetical protein
LLSSIPPVHLKKLALMLLNPTTSINKKGGSNPLFLPLAIDCLAHIDYY